MISEVDIRDWQEESKEGYRKYMADHANLLPYSNEVWNAACHWAFEYFWQKQERNAMSLWHKRQIMRREEEIND